MGAPQVCSQSEVLVAWGPHLQLASEVGAILLGPDPFTYGICTNSRRLASEPYCSPPAGVRTLSRTQIPS